MKPVSIAVAVAILLAVGYAGHLISEATGINRFVCVLLPVVITFLLLLYGWRLFRRRL